MSGRRSRRSPTSSGSLRISCQNGLSSNALAMRSAACWSSAAPQTSQTLSSTSIRRRRRRLLLLLWRSECAALIDCAEHLEHSTLVRIKDIVLSVLLPVVQKLHCSVRCVVELALICEFGTYYEVVGIILEGSRSEFATLIGVGPG